MHCLRNVNRKVHLACNFCLFENEGFLNVIGSRIQCECGSISETVQDRVVVTKDL